MRNKTSLNFQTQNSLFSSSCNFNELNLLFFFNLFDLPSLLGKQYNIFIQSIPILCLKAHLHNANQDTTCGMCIWCLKQAKRYMYMFYKSISAQFVKKENSNAVSVFWLFFNLCLSIIINTGIMTLIYINVHIL